MDISPHSNDILRENVEFCRGNFSFLTFDSTGGRDGFHVLGGVEIGDIAGIEDVVDVFYHAFVDDLDLFCFVLD
jgi:hypothetical protein